MVQDHWLRPSRRDPHTNTTYPASRGESPRPHAETQALDIAGEEARGATAYVTLEPCGARSSGGTSCSQLLVEAGVARVVVACDDPSPFAAGRGAERLRAAGIVVEMGLLAEEAKAALDYAAWFRTQTP